MSNNLFSISWLSVFIVVILIAFIGNIIIILAVLRDRSMHTSTYFYIINVNIADILLVLSCVPERVAEIFHPNDGFYLGMFTCYLLPFLQQVSVHAALGFLLILTVHRCYLAGVPRCLQRNLIRRQIRNHYQTMCLIWIFAIIINLPLFTLTTYEKYSNTTMNSTTNISESVSGPSCDTEARELWSRAYLILLLVFTYLITGVFLIIIYGQVIRIILNSKKLANRTNSNKRNNNNEDYHFLSRKTTNQRNNYFETPARSSSSSPQAISSNRLQQSSSKLSSPISIMIPMERTNSHSAQHLQVIVMLFVVILLYILLLLPYRLLNLLFIVYNELFQQHFMNEVLFKWLLNTVRLLVFLNCALQPVIYLIISSRLRRTVLKFHQSCWRRYYCQWRCSLSMRPEQHQQADQRVIQTYLCQRYQNINGQ
ncbi:unnamed protein product [Rotaria magnacalcarata]